MVPAVAGSRNFLQRTHSLVAKCAKTHLTTGGDGISTSPNPWSPSRPAWGGPGLTWRSGQGDGAVSEGNAVTEDDRIGLQEWIANQVRDRVLAAGESPQFVAALAVMSHEVLYALLSDPPGPPYAWVELLVSGLTHPSQPSLGEVLVALNDAVESERLASGMFSTIDEARDTQNREPPTP
jgi:hypothetical protein